MSITSRRSGKNYAFMLYVKYSIENKLNTGFITDDIKKLKQTFFLMFGKHLQYEVSKNSNCIYRLSYKEGKNE